MDKKNIDWANLGFGYIKTDKRYVSNYKDGAWDEGVLTEDDKVVISECAGVLQYAQTLVLAMFRQTRDLQQILKKVNGMMDSLQRMLQWSLMNVPEFYSMLRHVLKE